ncbi:hypothetical protein [uncultured Brevibacillus sp.]|nr:hypothetical protein [uncultured Brevibacillus sp.]
MATLLHDGLAVITTVRLNQMGYARIGGGGDKKTLLELPGAASRDDVAML